MRASRLQERVQVGADLGGSDGGLVTADDGTVAADEELQPRPFGITGKLSPRGGALSH